MKTTKHFEQRMQLRTELTHEICEAIRLQPIETRPQANGRIAHWGFVDNHYVKVVTLEDAETLHTAYRDRNYQPPAKD